MNVHELECLSIEKRVGEHTKIAELKGWAEGIAIFKIPSMLYWPQFGLQICNGFVPEEAINYPVHLDDIRNGVDDAILDIETAERSDDDVCILGHMYSNVFGHWAEELLKVAVLEEFGFEGPYVLSEIMPGFCRESLKLLGVQDERILFIGRGTVFRSAFLTTTINHFNANKFPRLILRLRDMLYDATSKERGIGRRIWVERGRQSRGRDVINKEEVLSCINQYGFVAIDFGKLPFRKQIGIDREIDIMLGAHGSAFVHCGFMCIERNVIEIFSPNYINPSCIQLCQALRHSYNQIVPVHQEHEPYKFGKEIMVDIDHLDLVLSSLHRRSRTWFGWRLLHQADWRIWEPTKR